MNQYLTAEQRAAFERQLAEEELTDEQKQAAIGQGMEMAQADMADQAGAGAADGALAGSGFDSVEALLAAYEKSQADLSEAEEALRRTQALVRALENGQALEPEAPEARSDSVRRAWQHRAGDMPDLQELLPEIAEYILAHPSIAMEEDGLQRAYDAVRAAKYRSDEALLDDPESVKKLAADPRVRDAVLTAHLAAVYRSGREVPAFIGGGGSIPAGAGKPQDGMAQAKARLEAMLKNN